MLKAKKKFTKKELKQDQFVIATLQAKSFVEKHSQKLFIGFIAFVAIIVLGYFWSQSKQAADEAATSLLTQAQFGMQNNQRDQAITIYMEILEQYDGTDGAAIAAFQLGKLYWEDNKQELAKTYFKTFIDNYSSNNFLLQAGYAGYADCLFAEKNYPEAAEYFERAANVEPGFPQAPAYLYSAAQAYKDAGNTGKARALAQRLADDDKNQQYKAQAEVLLQSL